MKKFISVVKKTTSVFGDLDSLPRYEVQSSLQRTIPVKLETSSLNSYVELPKGGVLTIWRF